MKKCISLLALLFPVTLVAQTSAITYQYDNLNRLKKVDYGNGKAIEYTYDDVGNRMTHNISDPNQKPTAPTALTATATGASTIDLSWTDNSNDETGFIIDRHDGSGIFADIDTIAANITNYTDSNLTAGTTYTYRVRAYNANGDSDFSNEAAATTDTPPPAAPTELIATATGVSTIDLSWTDNSNDETGFIIDRHDGSGIFADIDTIAANITNYTDSNLTAGTTYTYRVRAYNANGDSEFSNEAAATTDIELPAAPTSLVASATGTNSIELSWIDNSSNEDGFKIERKETGSVFTEIVSVGPDVTAYTDLGLNAATSYVYRVRAYNSAGYSNYSNEATATTIDPNTNLALNKTATASGTYAGAPASNAVDGNTSTYWGVQTVSAPNQWLRVDLGEPLPVGRIVLNWNDPYYATGYDIDVSEDDLTWLTVYSTTTGNGGIEEFTFTQTTARYVRLNMNTQNNSNGYSLYEFEIYSGDSEPVAPAAPGNLIASATGAETIELTWLDQSSNEDGFKLERKEENGAFSEIATLPANTSSYTDSGLTGATTYTYRIYAYNAVGNSAYSNESSATTDSPQPPAAPTDLAATAQSSSIIELTWIDNATNETGYKIERQDNGSSFIEIATVAANTTTWSDSGLTANTTYTYRVFAYNSAGNSAYSNEASATTDAPPPVPAAPDNLLATATGPYTINLTWNDNSTTEDGFKIERKQGSGAYSEIATVASNVTQYEDSGLNAATSYTYRIRAYNISGNSNYSNEASATTQDAIQVPVAPSNLISTSVTAKTVDLSWTDNADNEDGFKIERKEGSGTFIEIAAVSSNYTTYKDVGLLENTSYSYRVRAFNDGGDSEYSNVLSVSTSPGLDPNINIALNQPVSVGSQLGSYPKENAVDGNTSTAWAGEKANNNWIRVDVGADETVGRTIIRWADGYHATSYELQLSDDAVNWTTVYTTNAGAGGDEEVIFSQTVTRYVRLYMTAGVHSTYYGITEFEIYHGTGETLAPVAPSNLTATLQGSNSVELTWNDNSNNEDGFRIERKKESGIFVEIGTVGTDITSYIDNTTAGTTTYTYRIRAYNSPGNSSSSNEVSVTTGAPPKSPAAPTNLIASAISNTEIELTWTDNATNEDGYKIERKSDTGSFTEIAQVSTDISSYTDTGLTSNTTYTYRVRAFNSGGNSAYSNEASATTQNNTIQAPSNLAADAVSSSQIDLTWNDNSDNEDGFKIERKTATSSFGEIATVGAGITSYSDTGLTSGTTYIYRVRAYNAAVNSDYSNEASATTLDPNKNLALNKPVAVSGTYPGAPGSNAVDGDENTSWGVQTTGSTSTQWIRVDLEENQVIGRVIIKWNDPYYANNYQLQVSDDDINWTTVYSTASGTGATEEFTFTQTTTRYVRLYLTSQNNSNGYGIYEFEIYSGSNSTGVAKQNNRFYDKLSTTPNDYILYQNYPNPFDAKTNISFYLPDKSQVVIKLYDINGREVAVIEDRKYLRGMHTIAINLPTMASGHYILTIQANGNTISKIITLKK